MERYSPRDRIDNVTKRNLYSPAVVALSRDLLPKPCLRTYSFTATDRCRTSENSHGIVVKVF